MLDRRRAALVVVDVQEAFRAAILDFDALVANVAVLIESARLLGVPVLVTEQYPRGLGSTVPELASLLDGVERLPKVVFSAVGAEGFDLQGRTQALLCGIEAHVCVSQTAHELLAAGVEVQVAGDAISARSAANREVGMAKMVGAGAVPTSTETALFELLRRAGSDEFKAIQALVK